MKKMIIIAAAVLAAIAPMRAQVWKKHIIQGDELFNTKDTELIEYTTDEYSVGISHDPYFVIVNSQNSTFDFTMNGYAANIGLYNNKDELIEKTVVVAYIGDDFYSFSFRDTKSIFDPKWVKKIIDWLESGNGYVRISAKRYCDERLNVILPTMVEDEN